MKEIEESIRSQKYKKLSYFRLNPNQVMSKDIDQSIKLKVLRIDLARLPRYEVVDFH